MKTKISPFFRNYGSTVPDNNDSVSPLVAINMSRYRMKEKESEIPSENRSKPTLNPFDDDDQGENINSKHRICPLSASLSQGKPPASFNNVTAFELESSTELTINHSKHAIITLLESLNVWFLVIVLCVPIFLAGLLSIFMSNSSERVLLQANNSSSLPLSFICTAHSESFIFNCSSQYQRQSDMDLSISDHSPSYLFTRYIINFKLRTKSICNTSVIQRSIINSVLLKESMVSEKTFDLMRYSRMIHMGTCDLLTSNNDSFNHDYIDRYPFLDVDVPLLVFDRRIWPYFNFQSLVISNSTATNLLVSVPLSLKDAVYSSFTIERTASSSYFWSSIIAMSVSLVTLFVSIYYLQCIASHAMKLRKIFKLADNRIDVAESRLDRVRGVLELILPEQYNALAMLSFLWLWLNPIGALMALIGENYSPDSLGLLGFIQSAAGFGLLSSFVWLFDGLGISAADKSYSNAPQNERRKYERFTSSRTATAFNPFSPVGMERSSSESPRGYFQDTDASYWMKESAVREARDPVKPNRWLASTHIEYSSALMPHHPCSISFADFLANNLVLLLITWIVCGTFWTVQKPSWKPHDRIYRLNSYLLVGLSCVWLFLLFQAFISAHFRLKSIPYVQARFRKILYRVLFVKGLFCAILLIFLYFFHTISENVYDSFEPVSFFQIVEYHFVWFEGYCGGLLGVLLPQFPLLNPLLWSPAMSIIVVSSVYSVALFVHPPYNQFNEFEESGTKLSSDGSINSIEEMRKKFFQMFGLSVAYDSHSFMALEAARSSTTFDFIDEKICKEFAKKFAQYYRREQKDRMMKLYSSFIIKAANKRRPDLFCLETACSLLDAAYQAYSIDAHVSASINSTKVGPLNKQPIGDEPENIDDPKRKERNKLRERILALGLDLQATFSSDEYSIFGFAASRIERDYIVEQSVSNRLVVSFRGSIAANLFGTNMYVGQIQLPPLLKSSRLFLSMLDDSQGDIELPTLSVSTARSSNINNSMDTQGSLKSAILLEKQDDEELNLTSLSFDDGSESNSSSSLAGSPTVPFKSTHESRMRGLSAAPFPDIESNVIHPNNIVNDNSETSRLIDQAKVHEQDEKGERRIKLRPERDSDDLEGEEVIYDSICGINVQTYIAAIPILRQNFARVHSGFWHAYSSIRQSFLSTTVKYIHRHRINTLEALKIDHIQPLEIAICGHSLGAAIALLAALDIVENMESIIEAFFTREYLGNDEAEAALRACVEWDPTKGYRERKLFRWQMPLISVYTFGCPRVGNAQFAQRVLRRVKSVYRVAVSSDIVTMIPKFPFVYSHTGVPIILDADSPGSMIVNPTILESSFLKKPTGSIANHSLDIYRDCLVSCFESEELREYRRREFLVHSRASPSRERNIPDWLAAK